MVSAKHRPSPACLKAAAHLANNLMCSSNPAAKLELLAASCQRAQNHVAALAPKQPGPPQVGCWQLQRHLLALHRPWCMHATLHACLSG